MGVLQHPALWKSTICSAWKAVEQCLEQCFLLALPSGRPVVLDWLHDNGYDFDDPIVQELVIGDGALFGHQSALVWARDHFELDNPEVDARVGCAYAALKGDLPMLQWLRESGFPWDASSATPNVQGRRNHVVEWAIENGCPTPEDW